MAEEDSTRVQDVTQMRVWCHKGSGPISEDGPMMEK